MKDLILTICLSLILISCQYKQEEIASGEAHSRDSTMVAVEIDSATGLIKAQHFELVRAQCTACHAAQLITQNRASREGWLQMIRWMQESQGLWDLGEHEPKILDYLVKYYGPNRQGRRSPLTNIEWYELN